MDLPATLDERIAALSPQVDEAIGTGLRNGLKTLRVVRDPIAVLLPLSRISLLLLDKVFAAAGETRPSDNLFDCISKASNGSREGKIEGLNLLPRTLRENLDTIRKWTNPIDHADGSVPAASLDDAEIALNLFLRVLHWFYCEYEHGPRLPAISGGGDPAADLGNRYALVMGVSHYQDAEIPDLKFAADDARAVADSLIANGRFPEENVHLLVDDEATQRSMRVALTKISDVARQDLVVLYFAGHGCADIRTTADGGDDELTWKYLVPHDADRRYLRDTAISMDDLRDKFSEVRSERVVLLLDSCYSGAGERSFAVVDARGFYSDALLEEVAGNGRVVMAASSSNELAFEDEALKHGLFTYHLLEGLDGAADADGRGMVTVRQLYQYLADSIPERAKQLGGRQHPVFKGQLDMDFPMSFASPATRQGAAEDPVTPSDERRVEPGVLSKARAAHAREDFVEAVAELEALLPEAGSLRAEVLRELGRCHLTLGDEDVAEGVYRAAIDEEPGAAEGYCGLGLSLMAAGEFDRAVDAGRTAIDLEASAAPVLHQLQSALNQHLREHPDDGPAQVAMGRVLSLLDRPDQALEQLRLAAASWPVAELEGFATRLSRESDFQALRAVPAFVELVALVDQRLADYGLFSAALERAQSAAAQRDLTRASEEYRRCLDLIPSEDRERDLRQVELARDRARDLVGLARARLRDGDTAGAEASLAEASEIDVSNADLVSLGEELAEARESARKAAEHRRQSREHEEKGDLTAAAESMRRVLALGSADSEAAQRLAVLEGQLEAEHRAEELAAEAAELKARGETGEALSRLEVAANLVPAGHHIRARLAELDERLRSRHLVEFESGTLPAELAASWLHSGAEPTWEEIESVLLKASLLPIHEEDVRQVVGRRYRLEVRRARDLADDVRRRSLEAQNMILAGNLTGAAQEIESIRSMKPDARQLVEIERLLATETDARQRLAELRHKLESRDYVGVVALAKGASEDFRRRAEVSRIVEGARRGHRLELELETAFAQVSQWETTGSWADGLFLLSYMHSMRRYAPVRRPISEALQRARKRLEAIAEEMKTTVPGDMVVIPAGESTLGGGSATSARRGCRLLLGQYAIDRHPVTVEGYRVFLEHVTANGDEAYRHPHQPTRQSHRPQGWEDLTEEDERKPVTGVDWYDAYAFATWRGRRLPTEAEWERAALWDALHARAWKYPWGNELVPNVCNSAETELAGAVAVGSYPRGQSPSGILDACGNVWEWCADYYGRRPLRHAAANAAYRPPIEMPDESPDMPWVCDPRGPVHGDSRVLRGGSWHEDGEELRNGCRSCAFPTSAGPAIGFRCVSSAGDSMNSDRSAT